MALHFCCHHNFVECHCLLVSVAVRIFLFTLGFYELFLLGRNTVLHLLFSVAFFFVCYFLWLGVGVLLALLLCPSQDPRISQVPSALQRSLAQCQEQDQARLLRALSSLIFKSSEGADFAASLGRLCNSLSDSPYTNSTLVFCLVFL